jgi:hypothetical protein
MTNARPTSSPRRSGAQPPQALAWRQALPASLAAIDSKFNQAVFSKVASQYCTAAQSQMSLGHFRTLVTMTTMKPFSDTLLSSSVVSSFSTCEHRK